MSEIVVPALLTKVTTLVPGELRLVELTLPAQHEVNKISYPVYDVMSPGSAFLLKPWGYRTQKWRRRMYTRSNCRIGSERILETIINDTHTEKSDTSVWWQTEEVLAWQESGKSIAVRVEWNEDRSGLVIYENSRKVHATNLCLEPDGEWEQMSFLALALSTGITPFLSYLRYMQKKEFGRSANHGGAVFTLIVSVPHPQHLMAHEELLALERQFPNNFHYHPVLTRSWPEDWSFTKGRIIRVRTDAAEEQKIDISALRNILPDIHQHHVRFCGNKVARDQLQQGFTQHGIEPLSFRAEVW